MTFRFEAHGFATRATVGTPPLMLTATTPEARAHAGLFDDFGEEGETQLIVEVGERPDGWPDLIVSLRFKGAVPELSVTGLRTPEWLAESLGKPFRDWSGMCDSDLADSAVKAWDAADRAINKPDADAKRVLKRFINAFNKRLLQIDTILRELICDEYFVLATRAGVSPENAQAWLDDWREF